MTTFKPGQRVKIFYKADGSFGLGTIVEDKSQELGMGVRPDKFDDVWYLDAFRVELVEGVEV